MSRRRSHQARGQASFLQRLKSRLGRPSGGGGGRNRQPSSLRPEIGGSVLLIAAALTVLGLSNISSGTILNWWAGLLQRLFGWGAYALAIGAAFLGLRACWTEMRQRVPLGAAGIVGLELLVLALLAASDLPVAMATGADEAFSEAQQGQAGGLVGWTLAVQLVNTLGVVVGCLVLAAAILLGCYLLCFPWRGKIYDWGRREIRSLIAAAQRWRTQLEGVPVVPAAPAAPWWEQEPPKSESAQGKRATSKPTKKKAARLRPRDGSLPTLDLLDPALPQAYSDSDVRRKAQIIEETLASFGVPAHVVDVSQGPTVTQFGLDPGYIEKRVAGEIQQQRVRVSRIASLQDDLALALAAIHIRIEAPVPGRSVVGIEVPNEAISLVSLRGVLESRAFRRIDSPLAIALGEDVSGHPVAVDLGQMPHLLIAGATGSGKSVCINAIICSLLFSNAPEDLKMLMVDPKMVELVGYNDIPHLAAPVVVDAEQVVAALAWATRQMDQRYKLFHKQGSRNLQEYNRRVNPRAGEEPLPALVVVIDELADLMMVAPDEVERHICRLAQMGRATGIHLVVATQRPSTDVVTGLIKANFPARISFAVTSQVDSRVILDQGGAENLLGRGDMLFMSPQQVAPVRLQGCFVSDAEIERLTGFWKEREPAEQRSLFPPWTGFEAEEGTDGLLQRAIKLAEGQERISTSYIQRQLRIGFPRAARIIDQLEEQGVVGPDEGAGRGRQVLAGRPINLDKIDQRLPGREPD
jgi:S-DNA-T family DNA segregation ATPase FtsK/SpoIIIE